MTPITPKLEFDLTLEPREIAEHIDTISNATRRELIDTLLKNLRPGAHTHNLVSALVAQNTQEITREQLEELFPEQAQDLPSNRSSLNSNLQRRGIPYQIVEEHPFKSPSKTDPWKVKNTRVTTTEGISENTQNLHQQAQEALDTCGKNISRKHKAILAQIIGQPWGVKLPELYECATEVHSKRALKIVINDINQLALRGTQAKIFIRNNIVIIGSQSRNFELPELTEEQKETELLSEDPLATIKELLDLNIIKSPRRRKILEYLTSKTAIAYPNAEELVGIKPGFTLYHQLKFLNRDTLNRYGIQIKLLHPSRDITIMFLETTEGKPILPEGTTIADRHAFIDAYAAKPKANKRPSRRHSQIDLETEIRDGRELSLIVSKLVNAHFYPERNIESLQKLITEVGQIRISNSNKALLPTLDTFIIKLKKIRKLTIGLATTAAEAAETVIPEASTIPIPPRYASQVHF